MSIYLNTDNLYNTYDTSGDIIHAWYINTRLDYNKLQQVEEAALI